VENISFGLTICAERNAFCQAVAKGHSTFTHVAIIADTTTPISPCGACRQFMAEFGDLVVRSYTMDGNFCESRLSELLPRALDGILEEPPQR
jgi:cytidine deaminase